MHKNIKTEGIRMKGTDGLQVKRVGGEGIVKGIQVIRVEEDAML